MQRKEYEIAYFMNFLYLLQFRTDYKSLWFAENTAFSGFLSIGYSSNSSIIMCKINGFLKALQLFPWRREGMNNVIIWHDTQTAVNGFWHEESWQFFLLKYAAEHCWFFVPARWSRQYRRLLTKWCVWVIMLYGIYAKSLAKCKSRLKGVFCNFWR